MGRFRFRKTKKFGPVNVTFSNKGVGTSIGVKGARIGRGADGKTRISASIPGSGLSYQHTVGSGKRPQVAQPVSQPMPVPAPRRRGLPWWAWLLIGLFVIGGCNALLGGPPPTK